QNVAAKGEGLTLESYFDHQIDLAGHGLQLSLATLEQSRKLVEEAGAARRQLQSEPTLRAELARIAQLRQAGEAERDRQAALERELADAPERLCEADARVAALQEQLPAWQRAAERAGGLQAAQKSLISATHRQRDARTRLERAEQALQGLDAARAALEQAAQRLAEVGDARGSAAALRPRAA